MELFIRIKDGQPFEHPILDDNFRQAFPDVDTDNLPSTFARFERIAPPSIGVYEIYEGVTYEWINGIIKDIHHVRSMTEQERQAKINVVRASFTPDEDGWIFDENKCCWIASEI
tara:strand:+ start:189 stop:530 length:342 start_codon:yes stop_codon:yes gene_type:complete